MAPSTRGSRVAKRQAPLRAFTKVTKSTQPQLSAKARACEEFITPLVEIPQPHKQLSKRKRSAVEDDSEIEPENASSTAAGGKKVYLLLDVGKKSILIVVEGQTVPIELHQVAEI